MTKIESLARKLVERKVRPFSAVRRLLSSGAGKKFPDSLWIRGVGEAVTGKARVSIRKEGENTISFSFEIPWSAKVPKKVFASPEF